MLRDARSWYHLEFLIKCWSALQPERWRLFEVKLSIQDDPGKDIHDSSLSLCSAVALKLKCKVGVINEQLDFRLSYGHAVKLVDMLCMTADSMTILRHLQHKAALSALLLLQPQQAR